MGRSVNKLKVYFATRSSRTYWEIRYGDEGNGAVIGFQFKQLNRHWWNRLRWLRL